MNKVQFVQTRGLIQAGNYSHLQQFLCLACLNQHSYHCTSQQPSKAGFWSYPNLETSNIFLLSTGKIAVLPTWLFLATACPSSFQPNRMFLSQCHCSCCSLREECSSSLPYLLKSYSFLMLNSYSTSTLFFFFYL